MIITFFTISLFCHKCPMFLALSHAMARDGSSGGTIRMAVITKEGVERIFIPGDQLPKHWEG